MHAAGCFVWELIIPTWGLDHESVMTGWSLLKVYTQEMKLSTGEVEQQVSYCGMGPYASPNIVTPPVIRRVISVDLSTSYTNHAS